MCFVLDFPALASPIAGISEMQPCGAHAHTSLQALTVTFLTGLFGDPSILKVCWGGVGLWCGVVWCSGGLERLLERMIACRSGADT
jgi:hypothetical protein